MSSGAPDLFLLRVSKVNCANSLERVIIPLSELIGSDLQKDERRFKPNKNHDECDILGESFSRNTFRSNSQSNESKKQRSGGCTVRDLELEESNDEVDQFSAVNIDGIAGNKSQIVEPEFELDLELVECNEKDWTVQYEARCIEVKGPTDVLAYKQLFWLQMLNMPYLGNKMLGLLCRVQE